MAETMSLSNHFLIAMPSLQDPNFMRSVTYICEHNEEGCMGIMINRPLDISLGEVLRQLDIHTDDPQLIKQTVYLGGPVQNERGFVIHRPHGKWEAMLEVTDEIGVTSSRDILAAISAGKGPKNSLVALGYAGWGAGQLEQEIAHNAWLSTPADSSIIFETPSHKRWEAAAALGGIDLTKLSSEIGHA
ncbi:MAG TPA: YqgE/AlgH family protein [Gammaproteobacteria bacterium]